MINYIKRIAPLALAALMLSSSCTEFDRDADEQTQINTMDSTSKAVKETTDRMEDQTSKVEASLEKLNAEFTTDN